MSEHLSVGQVIEIHARMIGRMTRWPTALVNERGLVNALMRARTADKEEGADLIHQAAVLAVGLAQAHPFEDASPPTAFAALVAFLGINGATIRQDLTSDLARL